MSAVGSIYTDTRANYISSASLLNTACQYLWSAQCNSVKFSCSAKHFKSVSEYNVPGKHSSHYFANAVRSAPKHKTRNEKANAERPLEDQFNVKGMHVDSLSGSLNSHKLKFGLQWQCSRKASKPLRAMPVVLPSTLPSAAACSSYPRAIASNRLTVPPRENCAKAGERNLELVSTINKKKSTVYDSWEAESRTIFPQKTPNSLLTFCACY